MDPNELLRLIASVSASIAEASSRPGVMVHLQSFEDDVDDLARYTAELMAWIGNGGFLPDNWALNEA